MDPSESGGANNTNHKEEELPQPVAGSQREMEEGVHNNNKEKEVPPTKSQAPPESRATSDTLDKKMEEEEKRITAEIGALLGDLRADAAIHLHNELLGELTQRFGSKWATGSKK